MTRTMADWEDVARRVTCPICQVARGRRCRHRDLPQMRWSHTGRMVKALRGDPDWWRKVVGAQ